MQEKNSILDLLIIGAGPMGIALGVEAQKNNLSHIILEKGTLVNSIYHFPKNMTFFSTSAKLEIGKIPFMSINEKPKRDEALEYYRRVSEAWELNIRYYEEVLNVTKIEQHFVIQSKKEIYKAKNVVVATGFYGQPNLLNVPGEDLYKVSHYYDDAHAYIGQKVAVIGAGNSATQVALELYHKGIDVTMLIRGKTIKETVKYWIKPNIENRIAEGSIKAFFNSEVKEIKRSSIVFSQNGKEKIINNDMVLALIGYHPNYHLLNKIGINITQNHAQFPVFDENTHETNIPGLYIAGVVCGGRITNSYLIENSIIHAQKIMNSIVSELN